MQINKNSLQNTMKQTLSNKLLEKNQVKDGYMPSAGFFRKTSADTLGEGFFKDLKALKNGLPQKSEVMGEREKINELWEEIKETDLKEAASGGKATFGEIVKETGDKWAHEGKKLGTLATAIGGSVALPMSLLSIYPSVAMFFLGPAGFAASMALCTIEERTLGLGKKAGGLIGKALGSGAGVIKAGINEMMDKEPVENAKFKLPVKTPSGKGPKEALIPSLLHKAEKKILGEVPQRGAAVEICEGIGVMAATTATGMFIGNTVMGLVGGGPLGLVIATALTANIAGLVVGGLEENLIGVGRGAGELLGTAIGKLQSAVSHKTDKDETVKSQKPQETEKPPSPVSKVLSKTKDIVMKVLGVVGEPITSFLLQGTEMANMIFSEKPYLCMNFQDRPAPQVNRERLVKNFIKLTGTPGAPKQEQEIGSVICEQLKDLNIPYKQDEKGNIIAALPPSPGQESSPTVILSAHQDTVRATSLDSIRTDGKKIFTDGHHILGSDDRAGISQILEGLNTVLEKGIDHPEIKLVFTTGEEIGLVGSTFLTKEDITDRPSLGFVVDATTARNLHLTNDSVILAPSKSVKYNFSQEDPVAQVAIRSFSEAGIKPRPIHAPIIAGAGSDANTNVLNNDLIQTIAVGTGGKDLHTNMENIKVDDLELVANAVVGFISNSCDLKVEGNKVVPRNPVI